MLPAPAAENNHFSKTGSAGEFMHYISLTPHHRFYFFQVGRRGLIDSIYGPGKFFRI